MKTDTIKTSIYSAYRGASRGNAHVSEAINVFLKEGKNNPSLALMHEIDAEKRYIKTGFRENIQKSEDVYYTKFIMPLKHVKSMMKLVHRIATAKNGEKNRELLEEFNEEFERKYKTTGRLRKEILRMRAESDSIIRSINFKRREQRIKRLQSIKNRG